jgi:integrase
MSHVRDLRATNRGWVAVITNDKGLDDHSRSFDTQREAKAYITQQEAAKLAGKFVAPAKGNITVAEWFEARRLVTKRVRGRRASTQARNESYMASLIGPHLGHVRLRDLTREAIQGWVGTLCEQRYAPATTRKAHGILSQLCKIAVEERRIAFNPCNGVELPPDPIKGQRFLTMDEVMDLVDATDPRYQLTVLVCAVTGLRAGELFGLRVRDIDVGGGWLQVTQAVTEVKGQLDDDAPLKSRAATRLVPVPASVMDELADHIDGLQPDDLVFTAPEGGPVRLGLWRKRVWQKATIATGLGKMVPCTFFDEDDDGTAGSCANCKQDPKKPRGPHYVGLRIHDLRHTAISLWIASGRQLFHIVKFVGHTNSKLIEERYGHLYRENHDEANSVMDRTMSAARRRRAGDNVTPMRSRRPA